MSCKIAVESPDSTQLDVQAGSCQATPCTSWPEARKISLPVTAALAAGDAATALAGAAAETGAAGEAGADDTVTVGAAETVLAGAGLAAPAADVLPDELQAASSTAQPSTAPAAAARVHDKRAVFIDSPTHDVR
jgi:hypothetical protein